MGFISPKRFSYYKKDNVKNFPGRPGNAHKLYGIGSLVISLIILFAGSSCIRLDPSLYRFTPAMLAPDANVHAKFRAYSATNGISFEYDSKADAWTQINYTGPAGTLVSVAKTTNGFVGLHFTAASPTMVIYTSADGKTWTEVKNIAGISSGKVAACGDSVVVMYANVFDQLAITSSDAGQTFSATPVSVFVGSAYNWVLRDLQCVNNVFHVSADDSASTGTYKYSEDFGATWSAAGNPTLTSFAMRKFAVNGDTILGFNYESTDPTFVRSTDKGLSWTDNVGTISGASSVNAIAYNSNTGVVFAPHVFSLYNCYIESSADNGTTWNASPTIFPGCIFTSGSLSHVKSGDSTVLVLGYDNTEPIIILSTDSGSSFNIITTTVTTASIGGFTDLIVYYE